MISPSICPWWVGYLLAGPLRRLLCDPAALLAPYVREAMTVLEPGPGMGFFTLELARRVGPTGRVVAVDIQPKMIDGLKRRAAKAGLAERIDARVAPRPDTLGVGDLSNAVDFVLAFAVVHEIPSASVFFRESAQVLKPGALLLLAEPAGHVDQAEFASELEAAAEAGFAIVARPSIRRSSAALLQRSGESGRIK